LKIIDGKDSAPSLTEAIRLFIYCDSAEH